MKKFIFDVDGTITPSRKMMDLTFKKFFKEFCKNNQVYLVTGSDKKKTVEQIGEDVYNLAHTVYNCNGNDVWQGKKHVRVNDWWLKDKPHEWLSKQLTMSDFPVRTGLHFEHRPGMVNFSIVGRNANQTERAHYVKWDKERDERKNIAETFNYMFPTLEAKVGGETGIDISMKGMDKSQILKDFFDNDVLYFFGDAMHDGGNDQPLAKAIVDSNRGFVYNIQNWQNTWKLLEDYVD